MVTHLKGSTISKLEIQWMSFHRSVNNFVFHSIKHVGLHAKENVFVGNFTALLLKKSATEACKILVETYGNHALLKTTCKENNDFDVGEHSGAPKKFKDKKLEALLEDASWTCRLIWSWSHNSFEMFESIWNDSKARMLVLVYAVIGQEWANQFCLKNLPLQFKKR